MTQEILPGCRLVPLAIKGDERGQLVAIEGGRDAPFAIARAYYLFGTRPDAERGFHAHRRLSQLAVPVAGSCTMVLDNGDERREVRLDRPDRALFIGPMIWREMRDFSPDCVLLVLADAPHVEADYIRDYDAFLAAARR